MNDTKTAKALLKGLGIRLTGAVRIVLEILEESGGLGCTDVMGHCRKVIRKGAEALKLEQETVPFATAVEETIKAKAHRAERTLKDIRYYMRRLMREVEGLAGRPVRAITTRECSAMLERVYPTASQRKKARVILSGVFHTMQRRGWCGENPVARVDTPVVKEQEIRRLFNFVSTPCGG